MKKMKGVITAMTTPFDSQDRVDVKALEEQVEFPGHSHETITREVYSR